MIPEVLLILVLTPHCSPWRKTKTAHLVQFTYDFQKTHLHAYLYFSWTAGIYLHWFSCKNKWETVGQSDCSLNLFCKTRQPTVLRANQRASDFPITLLACIAISKQSVKLVTAFDSCIVFSVNPCWRSFLRFLVACRLEVSCVSLYAESGGPDLSASNKAVEVKVCLEKSSACQLPMSTELLWPAVHVRSDPGYFAATTTTLKVPFGTEVDD